MKGFRHHYRNPSGNLCHLDFTLNSEGGAVLIRRRVLGILKDEEAKTAFTQMQAHWPATILRQTPRYVVVEYLMPMTLAAAQALWAMMFRGLDEAGLITTSINLASDVEAE
jgi:hypothetical protein